MANVLVVGSGGREHALAWTLEQSEGVNKVYCAPGNGGTRNNVKIDVNSIEDLAKFAKENSVDLTVVGPEEPLSNGIVDYFNQNNLLCFGPTKAAAKIESSKIFAKRLMLTHRIPTAGDYFIVKPDEGVQTAVDCAEHILERSGGIVVKDDALAAGKGVTVITTAEAAPANVKGRTGRERWALDRAGDAISEILNKGHSALIEELLEGEEFSFIGVTDGETFVPFLSSQDHKRVADGDKGPNTGGMGAYAPAPVVTKEIQEEMIKIMDRAIGAMKNNKIKYQGFLYGGCMKTRDGIKMLEFNCRSGDPETQPILSLFKGDLYKGLYAAANQELDSAGNWATWRDGAACCVVLASKGYPLKYENSFRIEGLEKLAGADNVNVFHAGTAKAGERWITTGGRVLGVTGIGNDIQKAISNAYNAVSKVNFENIYFRKDIGDKALKYQN